MPESRHPAASVDAAQIVIIDLAVMVERFIHHRIGRAISILQTFRLVAGWLCGVHVEVDFSGEPFVAQFAHSTNRSVQSRTQNWDSWRPRDQFPNPHPHEFQCEEVCPITHPDTVPASSATAPLGRLSAPRRGLSNCRTLSPRRLLLVAQTVLQSQAGRGLSNCRRFPCNASLR